MKRLKTVFLLLIVSLILSCDTDRDDIDLSEAEARELNLIVQQGEWKISEYIFNNSNETANYSDYVFRFDDGNILSARALSDEVTGTWRISNDSGDEFDAFDDVDFHIFFSSNGKLGELANNYDVISATASQIRLRPGNTDSSTTLTFSKN